MAWIIAVNGLASDILWHPVTRRRPGGYPVFEWHHSWNDHEKSAEMYGAMWSLICGPNKYCIYIYVWHMYWVSLKSEKTIHCDFSSSNLSRNFDHQKNNIRSPFGQFLGWTSNQPWISVVIPLGAFRGTESWGITDWWLSRYVALSWSEVVRDSYAP